MQKINENNYRKYNWSEKNPRDPPVDLWPLAKHKLHVITNVG